MTDPPRASHHARSWRGAAPRLRIEAVLAAVLAAWLVATVVWPLGAARWAGIDFVQFWAVGQEIREGRARDVYSAAGRERLAASVKARALTSPSSRLRNAASARKRFETFSTPFLYQSLAWLTTGSYDRDLARFQWASIAAAAVAMLLLARSMGYGWTSAILLFLLLAVASEPMASDMRVANVNRLQLLGIAGHLWLQRSARTARQVVAGVILGLLVAFKPTLGPALPVLVLVGVATRQWRSMALQGVGFAAGGIAAVVATALGWGSLRPWWEWANALRTLERDADVTLRAGNHSAALLLDAAGVPHASTLLALALFAATAAVLWMARRGGGPGAPPADPGRLGLLAGSLAFAVSLWPLQLVWLHYYLLFAPLGLWLLRPPDASDASRGERRVERVFAAVAIACALGSPNALAGIGDSVELQALCFVLGAFGLVILGELELYRACRRSIGNSPEGRSGLKPGASGDPPNVAAARLGAHSHHRSSTRIGRADMATTFTSGTRVNSGIYVNARSFQLVNVERSGGVLPGTNAKFVRIPTLVAMAAAPALGGLFVVALPFIGFGVLGYAVIRALRGGAKEVAATVASAPMPAGSAALTGQESQKGATGEPVAHPEAEELAKEIEAKRGEK